jgi:hypothetical protein
MQKEEQYIADAPRWILYHGTSTYRLKGHSAREQLAHHRNGRREDIAYARAFCR